MHLSAPFLVLLLLCAGCLAAAAPGPQERGYYAAGRLAVMRENLEKHEWAREERTRILARAGRWAATDDERLRILVPPPGVPRAWRVHSADCPVHGQEILKHPGGHNSWKMDFDHPYRITCPVGGETYPSNDFLAYLKSGLKDRSLVAGEYADDGWGWSKGAGDKHGYWFVAYYAHQMARNYLLPALEDLSRAYLMTGEERYAHKCSLLLWQLAVYYPDYLYEKQSNYGTETDPHYYGRLLYHTWESWTVEKAALAYDAVRPALEEDAELQRVAGADAAAIRRLIEERLLRTMGRDITDGSHRIQGNYGMHQKAVLLVALALRHAPGTPDSRALVEWVVNNPVPSSLYTESAIHDTLVNLIHRDGVPMESPAYNAGWLRDLAEIADLLQANGLDLWQEERFRRVYLAPLDQMVCGQFSTPLGDSNNLFAAALCVSPDCLQRAFARMKEPRQARAMGQSGARPARDLFERPIDDEIAAAAKAHPQEIGVQSSLLPGRGILSLQAGTPGHRTGLSLLYGYYEAHAHFDALNVDFYAEGNPLTPDLGYPETADGYDPRRFGFLSHTVTHNTCMVDARRQELGRGRLVAFHPGAFAQMAEVTNTACNPGRVQDYRRSVFLIEASPEHAYYLDIFRVAGGSQHDLLLHGTEAEFDASLALSEPRKEGTLAGPDVPYGRFYDEDAFKASTYGLPYRNYGGSALQWLTNVQQATVKRSSETAPWARWRLNRDPNLFPKYPVEGVALRVHLVPDDESVFACDGIPQRRPNFPERLKWLVRRREGKDLQSAFVSVLEGYKDTPFVAGVRRLPVEGPEGAVAVAVDLGGRKHVVVSSPDPDGECVVDGRIRMRGRGACLELDAAGKVVRAALFDGRSLECGAFRLEGPGVRRAAVQEVDYAGGTLTLDKPVLRREDEGLWVPVSSDTHEASVRIERVLDPSRFSIGRQDLRAGRGRVVELQGKTLKSNSVAYFVEPGMAVVNEAGRRVGRIESAQGLTFTLREPLKEEDLPDTNGDGARRFTVMAISAGDTVGLGCRAEP